MKRIGRENNNTRVLRGGCWGSSPSFARVAIRYWYTPGYRYDYFCFRICRGVR